MSWDNEEALWAMGVYDELFGIENLSPVSEARSCSGGSESEIIDEITGDRKEWAKKRRRFMALSDDDTEGVGETELKKRRARRMLVKNLEKDFDRVASENDVSETGNEGENGRSKRKYDDDDDDGPMKLAEKVIKRDSDEKGSQIHGSKNTVSASGVLGSELSPDCIA